MLVNGILEIFSGKKLVSATGMTGADSSNTITTHRVMKNFTCVATLYLSHPMAMG